MTTVGIDPTTVENAGSIMARTLGLRWPQDRSEILEYINDFRDILYNSYQDLKLFDNVFHCICVSSFPEMCGHPCSDSPCYQGFVLPDDVASVESAWEYGMPLKVRSRWREALFGLDQSHPPRVEIVEMAEQTCTERALQTVTGLKIFAESDEDNGRKVRIEAVMHDGERRTLCFDLKADGWVVIDSPVRQIVSVSLPPGRRGNLVLAQSDGYQLSIYGPHETVPVYRKFRVASLGRYGTILIQGAKRFVPVFNDYDVVEVGSRMVLKSAGSFLKFRENTTERKDLNRAAYDKTEMGSYLVGLQARHRGNASQDLSIVTGRSVNTSNIMPGYSR